MYSKFLTSVIILIIGISYSGKTQNVSYNLNSIPVTGTNNSAFGFQSLFSNTTGTDNSGFGTKVLSLNNTGIGNTGIGALSIQKNTSGNFNTGVGISTLRENTIGYSNTAIGSNALQNNISGYQNIAIGPATLTGNISGFSNTAVGYLAMSYLSTGNDNVGVGTLSLHGNNGNFNTSINARDAAVVIANSSSNNTFVGYNAGKGISSGSANTILGANVVGLPSSLSNTIILADGSGNQRLYINNLGNSGFGTTTPLAKVEINSGISNISGLKFSQLTSFSSTGPITNKVLTVDPIGNVVLNNNPFSWYLAGNAGTIDGIDFIGTTDNAPLNFRVNNLKAGRIDNVLNNVFLGMNAGASTTGFNNCFIGTDAGAGNTTGFENAAIGYQTLQNNTIGDGNVAIGINALQFNTTGRANVALGYFALNQNVSGVSNFAMGSGSLVENINGNFNIAIGGSLNNNTSGGSNIAIGLQSLLHNSTGNFNTGIGTSTNVANFNLQNAVAIGYNTIVNASNKIRLGSTTVTAVEGPVMYTVSDKRFKYNVSETDIKGLAFIKLLRPVVYNFDTKKFQEFLVQDMDDSVQKKHINNINFQPSSNIRQSGFIAQEVEAAAKESGYEFNGVHIPESSVDNYSLSYSQFVVPLVKAVQELSEQNDELKKEIKELRSLIMEKKSAEGVITITESDARLYQNAPNPFNQATTIKYSLPAGAKNASIIVYSSNGTIIKEYQLNTKSQQLLSISGGQLAAGSYIYSLFVDKKLIDTKKMILTQN